MENIDIPWNNKNIKEIKLSGNKDENIKQLTLYIEYIAEHLNETNDRCNKLEKEIRILKQKL